MITTNSRNQAQWGITQIRKKGLRDFGAALAPEAAHHLSVGSDTLSLRIHKACDNALTLASYCDQHAKVKKFLPWPAESPTTSACR